MKRFFAFLAAVACAAMIWAQGPGATPIQISELNGEAADFWTIDLKDGTTTVVWNQATDGWSKVQMFLNSIQNGASVMPGGKPVFVGGDYGSRSYSLFEHRQAFADADDNILVITNDCRNAEAQGDYSGRLCSYALYKVNKYGEMLWKEPVDLGRGKAGEHASVSITQLTDGSYVVAWTCFTDDLSLYPQDENRMYVMMERVSKDGKLLWNAPKVLMSADKDIFYSYLFDGGDNEFVIVSLRGMEMYMVANCFDANGDPVWDEETLINCGRYADISTGAAIYPIFDFQSDGHGGVLAAWHDFSVDPELEVIRMSHIDRNGEYVYDSEVGGTRVTNIIDAGLAYRSQLPRFVEDKETGNIFVVHKTVEPIFQKMSSLVLQKLDKDGDPVWKPEGVQVEGVQRCSFDCSHIVLDKDGNPVVFYLVYIEPDTETELSGCHIFAQKFSKTDGSKMWEQRVEVPLNNEYPFISDFRVSPLLDGDHWMITWAGQATPSVMTSAPVLFMTSFADDGTTKVVEVLEEPSGDATARYFNLSGMRVPASRLAPGLYIKCQGQQTTKIMVK
ncbi:MAG: hypothetical protein HUK02_07425 [Bacteroidaceae bacterium]|nr:hypothetical protein [Bacteroidaceae bacterium]